MVTDRGDQPEMSFCSGTELAVEIGGRQVFGIFGQELHKCGRDTDCEPKILSHSGLEHVKRDAWLLGGNRDHCAWAAHRVRWRFRIGLHSNS
jgi:hypothetical protein